MAHLPYHRREIAPLLQRLLGQFPVVVVSGLRQTGKSTLLQEEPAVSRGRTYVTLDDLDAFALSRDDPSRLLNNAARLAVDEVQRSPEIFLTIKRLVDQQRDPGQFVLSGSANLLLHQRVADSLAGRAYYAYLHPLNRRERLGALGEQPALLRFVDEGSWPAVSMPAVDDLEIMRGGFPEVALRPEIDAGLWFDAFERTYLERDVRDLRQVEDLVGLHRLLRLAALRVGSVLNISGLARDARLTESTARRYLDLLETLMVLRRLPPFLGNRSSRLIKSAKLYFADSGLAARLASVTSIAAASADSLRGALIETFVLQNLVATLEPHAPDVRFYYWNEQSQREVDFVIELGKKVIAIEVKAQGRIHPADSKNLENFLGRTPACAAGILAYQGDKVLEIRDKIWAVPLSVLLA
jgi:predicted AAA+ superfamily ATPase